MEFSSAFLRTDEWRNPSRKELVDFCEKFTIFSDSELEEALFFQKEEFMTTLNQLVPCIGCRTRAEARFRYFQNVSDDEFHPFRCDSNGSVSVAKDKMDPRFISLLFLQLRWRFNKFIEMASECKTGICRCNLHKIGSPRNLFIDRDRQDFEEETRTKEIMMTITVHALHRRFVLAFEKKRGISQLELFYLQLTKEEQDKEREKKKKIRRRNRRRRAAAKTSDSDPEEEPETSPEPGEQFTDADGACGYTPSQEQQEDTCNDEPWEEVAPKTKKKSGKKGKKKANNASVELASSQAANEMVTKSEPTPQKGTESRILQGPYRSLMEQLEDAGLSDNEEESDWVPPEISAIQSPSWSQEREQLRETLKMNFQEMVSKRKTGCFRRIGCNEQQHAADRICADCCEGGENQAPNKSAKDANPQKDSDTTSPKKSTGSGNNGGKKKGNGGGGGQYNRRYKGKNRR